MEYTSQETTVFPATTLLTAEYVYNASLVTAPHLGQFPIKSYNCHDIFIMYDPDEGSPAQLEISVEESPDDVTVSSADTATADKWFPICAEASAAGVRTLTPDVATIVSGGAGTKMYRSWRDIRTHGKKMRVGVRETGPVSADFGNALVVVSSRYV